MLETQIAHSKEVRIQASSPSKKDNLSGSFTLLRPMSLKDSDFLYHFLKKEDPQDWLYLPYGQPKNEIDTITWIGKLVNTGAIPYLISDKEDNPVGVLCIDKIDLKRGKAEIGHAYLARGHRGSVFMKEAVFLLLTQLFGGGFVRVQATCHHENVPSSRFISKCGFEHEGTLRNDDCYKGMVRHTKLFSIVSEEWTIKSKALFANIYS